MEKLLALQMNRIAFLIDSLEDVKMDIVLFEDAMFTTAKEYDDSAALTQTMEAISVLKMLQEDMNTIRRKMIQFRG